MRAQILGGGDCRFCSEKCAGKRYEFVHDGKEYVKCQYLCCNFRLFIRTEGELADLGKMIKAELAYKKPKNK